MSLQVTIVTRRAEDELLLLASDGLWDVLSNQVHSPVSSDRCSCRAGCIICNLLKASAEVHVSTFVWLLTDGDRSALMQPCHCMCCTTRCQQQPSPLCSLLLD